MDDHPARDPNTPFDSDQPIVNKAGDLLGRSLYSDSIAGYIRNLPFSHGFSIAVMGEWGSGKSSVLNMVAEVLAEEGNDVAVLRFNPWLFGGTPELLGRFYSELGAQLGQDDSEKLKEIAKTLSKFGQSLAPLVPLPGTTNVAFFLDQLVHAWARPPSLLSQRDRLTELLNESGCKIVVLVDDIDRLEDAEVREMMRLIRLTSDLPNVIFLVAFDRAKVCASLGYGDELSGSDYLDKIIQIAYNLPTIRFEALQQLLFGRLDVLIQQRDLRPLEQQSWTEVYLGIIRPLLSNVRDVKRYLNSLPVALDTIGKEVALADLLALEALRVMSPWIFDELRLHSDLLVQSRNLYPSDDSRKEGLETMMERAGERGSLVATVLRVLFPSTQSVLSNSNYGSLSGDMWVRERRVACEDVLRIYFQSGLDSESIPSSLIEEIVENLGNEERLTALLDDMPDEKLLAVMERLFAYESSFGTESAGATVPFLANRIDRFNYELTTPTSIPSRALVRLLIVRLLEIAGRPGGIEGCLSEILAKIPRLSGRLVVIDAVGHRDRVGKGLVSENIASTLETQFLQEVKTTPVEELASECELNRICFLPGVWPLIEEGVGLVPRLVEHLENESFLLGLLRTGVGTVIVGTERKRTIQWDELLKVFGEPLREAVLGLDLSETSSSFSPEDLEIVDLAKDYASGNVDQFWNFVQGGQ